MVCLPWLSPAGADTGLGRHKKVYAVPVPGKVVIDGDLNDWDLSAQIHMYVVSETSDMQSARFALMYDRDALYISGVLRDPSPMMNRHDPNVDPDKAWDADVCQLFLSLDPRRPYPLVLTGEKKEEPDMCTLLLWHYTDRHEANLVALKAMTFSKPVRPDLSANGVIPRDKFQAAYKKAADGRGYTLEYRIPWETLGCPKTPVAGDILAGSVCFFWGTPDGFKTGGGSSWCYDVMAGPGFVYQSSSVWGKIIFSAKGRLPHDMVEEGLPPEKPLPLTFDYDLPQDSEVSLVLMNDKAHMVRTLVAQGARRAGRNVERWDGLDDAGQPLPAGTYSWKGIYHQPIKTKFVLSAHNSGQPPYKTDDNTGGWGGDHGNPTTVCAAGDAMFLAWKVSESGWGIIKTNLQGKKLWGIKHNATDMAWDGQRLFVAGDFGFEGANSVKVFDPTDGRPLNWGNGKPFLEPPPGGDEKTNVAGGVACQAGLVYASWPGRGIVAGYDTKGNLQSQFPVAEPGSLAAVADKSLLVISHGQVDSIVADKVQPFITDHLDSPRGIACGPAGEIFVANAGALQNISVFSSTGKFLRSIGKSGGRPRVGLYDSSGILEPGGIAVDKTGHLWVAETLDSPKRDSVWNTQSGALEQEFFGASSYFGWAYIDPKHPDELYCHNVLWKVDLSSGACRPYSTIWRATQPNMPNEANPGGYAGHFRVMTARNGKQYGWGMSDYSNMLFMREGDIFKPIAGTIRVAFGEYGSGLLYPAMKEFHEAHKAPAYLWQDANNDQTIQPEELTVSPSQRGETTFNWIDADLNAWCDDGYIFKPVRFAEDGRPVYDFSKKDPIPWKGSNANGTSLWLDNSDDTVYTLSPGGEPGLARWSRDGKLLWGYSNIKPWPEALSLPMVTPGKLWGLTMPLGVAGDFTGSACYFGPYHLFTRDGIYVAMLMRDGRSGGLGPDITASETMTGQLLKPDGQNRYFLLAGDQDGRVTEITGLDTVKRLAGGTYLHTAASAGKASAALAAYERARSQGMRLDIVRGEAALATARPATKSVDAERGFSARLAYDSRNLYVQYEVTSPNELVNQITDPRLIFKGGNLIDLQIATDPAADPKRKTPAPGDLRLLITRQAGKAAAVLYRPRVKGFTGKPVALTSPTGKEPFDSIEATDRVNLTYTRTATGFNVKATIPLDLLGWHPQPGQSVRLDLGYIFGNALGSQAALRSYWTNNGFAANVTNDVPNESRLEPGQWGSATVE